jgi:large subunit ribosomal protein L9
MPVKLILKEDIDSLGKAGDLVNVKQGYARNFLIPNDHAILATLPNLIWLKNHREKLEQESKQKKDTALSDKQTLENLEEITIYSQIGPTGKLYGRITSRDIAEQINEFSRDKLNIKHKSVSIPSHIHGIDELGLYEVSVNFGAGIKGQLCLIVQEG